MHEDIIKGSALFSGLDSGDLAAALAFFCASTRTFSRGSSLHRMGEPLRRFGLMLEGSANVISYDHSGTPMIMHTVAPGDTFGESLCFLGIPAYVHIEAVLPGAVLWLAADRLKGAPLATPLEYELAGRFTAMLASRTLNMNDRIQVLSKHTLRDKLNTFFSQCARSYGSSFSLPFDRERMAAYLGADRSALSRELSRMQKDGLIRFHKSSFQLIDK